LDLTRQLPPASYAKRRKAFFNIFQAALAEILLGQCSLFAAAMAKGRIEEIYQSSNHIALNIA